MSDIDEVIDLLERWRDADGMSRMRIGVEAAQTIRGLSVGRKRELAVEVASRVAPELVPAIESEEGDLSAEQVGAVVDLLRRADREQLDELVHALRTGDVDGTLELVDEAVEAVVPPPPPPTEGPDESDEDLGVVDQAVAAELVDDEVAVADDGTLELDEEAVRERLEAEAAERAAMYRDSSRSEPTGPAYRAPTLDFISEDLDLPDPTVAAVAPLHQRMAESSTTAASHELAAGPVSATVAAITATPDGYRRRRAACAAIRQERLAAEDLAPVVRSFERGTDRTWIAGAALDAGLIGPGDLEDLLLSPESTARLRRRAV